MSAFFIFGGNKMKKYLEPEEMAEVKKIDLLTYLSNYEPHELVRKSRNDYVTRTHDSLHMTNGMWMWWSRGIGGKTALDYLIKVHDMPFLDAALLIYQCITENPPVIKKTYHIKPKYNDFRLPMVCTKPRKMFDYLINERCIDKDIVNFYYLIGYIYECQKDHSVVFVGYDERGKATFASKRATNDKWKKDVYGSDKHYSFRLVNKANEVVHIFESPIDLMSFQTLEKQKGKKWNHENYLSLAGVAFIGKDIQSSELPLSLEHFLMNNKQIKEIVLHLDNDRAGYETSEKIKYHLSERYEIINRNPKRFKDMNEVLSFEMSSKLLSLSR